MMPTMVRGRPALQPYAAMLLLMLGGAAAHASATDDLALVATTLPARGLKQYWKDQTPVVPKVTTQPQQISAQIGELINSLVNGNRPSTIAQTQNAVSIALGLPSTDMLFAPNRYENVTRQTLIGAFTEFKPQPLVTTNAQSFQLSVSNLPFVSGRPDLTELIYLRAQRISPAGLVPLAPIGRPEADAVVAGAFRTGTGAVILSGAGVFPAVVSSVCSNLTPEQIRALGSFFRFTALLAALAVEKFGADPHLEVWVQLSLQGNLPIGITITSLDRALSSAGQTSYTLADLPAVTAAAVQVFGPFPTAPVPTSIAPLAENAASLIEQALAFVEPVPFPSAQITLQRLVETFIQQSIANVTADLVAPYLQLTGFAKGVISSDYDIFDEQILNRTGLDFREIEFGAGLATIPNPAFTFFESAVQSEYVVHFHGFFYNKGVMVYSLGSYEQTAPETVRFLFDVAVKYSYVFVGTAGGIFDPHFLLTFLQLFRAGSTQKHYLLLVQDEVAMIQDMFAALGGLGAYMASVVQIIVYAPDSDFGQLPKFIQAVVNLLH